MTETQTQEAPPAASFTLAPPRGKLKTGVPTDGLWIIVGLPKSGKSSLGTSIPGSVTLELEKGGADRLSGWIQDINDMTAFRQALKAAVAEPKAKAIVIDSIDILNDWMEAEVAAQFGLDSVSQRKEGTNSFEVWKELRARYEGMLGYLRATNKLVVFIAHCKEVKLDSDGRVVIPAGINIPGKLGSYVAAQVDVIGNCFKKQVGSKTEFFLSFQGGPLGAYGSRISELEDKTITLPKTEQWGAIEALFKPGAQPSGGQVEQAKTNGKAPAKGKGGR